MKGFRYIDNATTLRLDEQACIGCGNCQNVCPHRIFEIMDKKAVIRDLNACMECGACAMNCPVEAITVSPGVGCAVEIIASWVNTAAGRQILKGCC
ncbi:MAG: mercury methylation ferredoxin HgcB [Desulfosarcinaceae bacterium]|jgi:NAD-dependent dihydropyrimidine dehydrogenase PreA subunit